MPGGCPKAGGIPTPAALGSHAGAKNTGSLAVSEVENRSMIAGYW